MIREAIETLGPVGSLKASEYLDGLTLMHEADELRADLAKWPPRPVKLPEVGRLTDY